MRPLLTIAAVAAALATTSTSNAQTNTIPYYPWCSVDTADQDGREGRNCGFTSYAQCMSYVRGQTGICFENIWGVNRPSVTPSEETRPRRR